MNINEENNGSANNGGKSRFFERLKKIQYFKRKKRKIVVEEESKKQNTKFDNRRIFKPFLVASTLIVGAVKTEEKQQKNENITLDTNNNVFNKKNSRYGEKQIVENHINKNIENNYFIKDKNKENNVEERVNKNIKIQELQIDIINSIKKRLVKNINELEMLRSELYILKEVTGEDVYLSECTEKVKEVKKLLSKIKNLKEKYDCLKNNIDFDYLLEMADDSLVDKIIELKDICSSDDIRYTVQNYKILEEYKYLYLKIDKLEEDVIKYNDYKKNKEEDLKSRDIDFEKLKNDVYNKGFEQKRYDSFINEQEIFLKELNEKISKIDSREVVNYKIKGFEQLVGNSFKYLGLLLASPFKGIFPGIMTQTIATRNVIHNLYNNLEIEENKKIVYEAIDFSSSINLAINDMENALGLIDVTLDDIRNLKTKYKNEFAKYENSFSNYAEIIKKINKMENAVLNNKIKIELMKQKMYEKEKENEEKMKRVKKLNCSVE